MNRLTVRPRTTGDLAQVESPRAAQGGHVVPGRKSPAGIRRRVGRRLGDLKPGSQLGAVPGDDEHA